MLSHPDPQIQYIFTTLEGQRDNLIIENGNLSARVKELEGRLQQVVVDETPTETALVESAGDASN